MRMKYIRFENNDFLLFPESQKHSDFAGNRANDVVSAGFVVICCDEDESVARCCCGNSASLEIECYGHSVSLGIGSSEEDSYALKVKTRDMPF